MKPALIMTLCLSLMSGCNPLHTAKKPDSINSVLGQSDWSRTGTSRALSDRWWMDFDDPALNTTVDKLHSQNLDLAQAWSRLAQAHAAREGAASAQWPSVDASLGGTRARGYDFMGEAQTSNQFSGSVGAAYEVDIWNKLGNRRRAAVYEYQATRQDLASLATTLTAQVVDLWFDLAELRSTKALIQRQIETNQTQLDLIRYRYGHGLAQATAVLQQEQQLHATRGLLPPVLGRIESAQNQLALLLGQPPSAREAVSPSSNPLPSLKPLPSLGVPSDLLSRRPDIRAGQLRVAAADERVGAAIADRLPSFRIQASIGAGAQSFGDLLDRWIWNLTSSVVAPLFDGGRRAAEVARARAATKGLLSGFKLTYLRAVNELETALIQEHRESQRLTHLKTELKVARSLLKESRSRYLEGLTDYLPVLSALKSVQRAERSTLTGQRALLSHRVRLYRALGGSWTQALKPKTQGGS